MKFVEENRDAFYLDAHDRLSAAGGSHSLYCPVYYPEHKI